MWGGAPAANQHEESVADVGQLAVDPLLAKTVRPFTVASTTGKPARAACRRNTRRFSTAVNGVDGSALGCSVPGCFERSRSGRELSAMHTPAALLPSLQAVANRLISSHLRAIVATTECPRRSMRS